MNNKCDICGAEALDYEFGIDIAPFDLCEECYDKHIDPIRKGVKAVFTYIAALNPETTSNKVEYTNEFLCEVCNNVEDYSNFHILWLSGEHYHTCDYCARQLKIVIDSVLQILRSARNGELEWMNLTK